VNYFEHHIGDYDKDTSHLTACEDGIYCRLIRRYYNTEAPLPNNLPLIERLVRAHSKDERKAVGAMLREFFQLADDGWHHVRCDKELARYQDKQDKARRSANARWSQCERNANASETHDDRNALQSPVTSNQKEQERLSADACPHADILALYHASLPTAPRIKSWTGKRQANLRARWREDAKRQDLDYWQRFFAHVAASPFLTGRVTGQGGRPFFAGLDWLVMPENFAKVIEGRYHDRS
jgi:uncharacterized protein YdaU (DUF1376 family)